MQIDAEVSAEEMTREGRKTEEKGDGKRGRLGVANPPLDNASKIKVKVS